MTNKRVSPRKRGRVQARFGLDGLDHMAFTSNLSLTGAFLRTNHVFKPGTTIQIELEFPEERISLWAQVAWSKRAPPQLTHTVLCGMGLRFINPGPDWEARFG